MARSSRSRMEYVIAIALAAAPVGAGVIRLVQTRNDFRYLWLGLAAYAATYVVMRIGKSRSVTMRGLIWLTLIAFVVATLVDVLLGRLLGARAMIGVWLVAVVVALLAALSQLLENHAWRADHVAP